MSAIAFNGEIYPSGARAASDQVYDNSNTGLPANVQGALDKTTGNISSLDTVELTATAAHAHAAGSTFLWIGQLVKATAAIAVGDTIAVGTNVENTTIVDVMDEVNRKSMAERMKDGLTIALRVQGNCLGGAEIYFPIPFPYVFTNAGSISLTDFTFYVFAVSGTVSNTYVDELNNGGCDVRVTMSTNNAAGSYQANVKYKISGY